MAIRRLRDIPNQDFGILNVSKNKHLVRYNASLEKFTLSSIDTVLTSDQVLDGDLQDDFVTQIESEIDGANLDFKGIDGGGFL